jgi:hypothetical protein
MTNQQLACPRCGQIDQIQKVSSVFSSGISTGTYSGSTATFVSGSSQTFLSKKLSPPKKPEASCSSCAEIGITIILFLFGGFLILSTFLSISCNLRAIFSGEVRVVPAIILGLLGVGIGGGLILTGIIVWGSSQKAADRRAVEEAAQMTKWELAMSRWNQLYYCYRDDGVFDPDERVFIPVKQMMNYLYR